jgi:glutathione S-transferase
MPDQVELYFLPASHYCVSVERMLAYKGVRAKLLYAPYHDRQELLQRTGQDYVPTLIWKGRPVTWPHIPQFLDEKVPDRPLVPAGQAGLAQTLENWGHQVLEERVWRAVVTQMPKMLKTDEERWVFEEMQTRARGPWHVLKARRPEFVRDLMEYFAFVDAMVRDREWILESPSLADFGIYGGLSPWLTVGEKVPVRFPALRAWVKRVEAI